MSARQKVWMIVGLMVALVAAAIYGVAHVLTVQNAYTLETETALRAASQAASRLDAQVLRLSRDAEVWAQTDAAHTLLQSPPDSLPDSLNALVNEYGLDFALVQFTDRREPVYAAGEPLRASLDRLLAEQDPQFDITGVTATTGVSLLREGLTLVARVLVYPAGEPTAFVTWGRVLDDSALMRIAGPGSTAAVYPAGSPALPPATVGLAADPSADQVTVAPVRAGQPLAGYVPLIALYRTPVAYLQIVPSGSPVADATALLQRTALVIGAAALGFALALVVLIQRIVITPLERSRITIVADPSGMPPTATSGTSGDVYPNLGSLPS